MKDTIALIAILIILAMGLYYGNSTGFAIYTPKPDLHVQEILAHGVDTNTNEMHIFYSLENSGDATLEQGTEISTRVIVRYTEPPVSHGSISLAEVFFEEAKATYTLTENLNPGESVLVASPAIPILISTVRFFERYHIKNRITIELDTSRKIQEQDEKNNKLIKWYYMQQWEQPEDIALLPD